MQRMRVFYLLTTVILCGGVVMALEVLGTRVIGTYYGSSLTIWAALITVTLASLSTGYYLIGMFSDRFPRPSVLYFLIFLAGCAVLLALLGKHVLAPFHKIFGAEWGAIVSAFVIFTPSLTLLGGVGPFAIRLVAAEREKLGKRAGSIYALSTIGSVIGTLLVSFILIPKIGTTVSIIGVSILLILLAGVGLILESGRRGATITLLFILLPLVPFIWGGTTEEQRGDYKLLFRRESLYSRFVVVDNITSRERMLLVNGIQQTGMPLDENLLEANVQLQTNRYYYELLRYYNGTGSRALLIGLAGGMLPRVLATHGIDTTAVDIDGMAVSISREFFGYGGTAVVMDGRRFIEDCQEKYDYCIIDAYTSDVIPFHLITEEMFIAVRRILRDEGILAINYIGFPRGETAGSIYKTVARVFENNLDVYKTEETDDVQTVIIFASPKPLSLTPLWPSAIEGLGVDTLSYELGRHKVDWHDVPGIILTDDYNPSDFMRTTESILWRQKTIETFGDAVLW